MGYFIFFAAIAFAFISPKIGGSLVFLIGLWVIVRLQTQVLPKLENTNGRACPSCGSTNCEYGYGMADARELGTCKNCGTSFVVRDEASIRMQANQLRQGQRLYAVITAVALFLALRGWGVI